MTEELNKVFNVVRVEAADNLSIWRRSRTSFAEGMAFGVAMLWRLLALELREDGQEAEGFFTNLQKEVERHLSSLLDSPPSKAPTLDEAAPSPVAATE